MVSFGNKPPNYPIRTPKVIISRASFNSKIKQFITEPRHFVAYLQKFCSCSRNHCVYGDERDTDHYIKTALCQKLFFLPSPVLGTYLRGAKILFKTKDPKQNLRTKTCKCCKCQKRKYGKSKKLFTLATSLRALLNYLEDYQAFFTFTTL
ncbi:hypothetical protein AVEN_100604-1 [Araneus ventricosus]|uniref:Uncharacterized protein n=1 Tax=Araneus ventricosus TaxID=182803 RepID=A0A4Y2REH8_ARAVE|nr:hypothetical protein AVEN_43132-1 [Araneus ventricosus]GBN62333.1 hypothetical protein AVEN_219417-1 [Araneus ventricosus]GBN74057.1 hypothetical protein AVEN_207538-1 [Araneus ventricosus]GBN74093.1 hypothetical protein AVEN_100604-1 [Araneus ventricosus]